MISQALSHAGRTGHLRRVILLAAACLALISQDVPASASARQQGQGLRDVQESGENYVRTLARYEIPAVDLIDTDGAAVPLAKVLDGDNPVMLNFIFTSCGAICPVMSSTFASIQAELGPKQRDLILVSISIDPEQDTPKALKNYARHYGAGPRWKMLTGSAGDSVAVQRAFNAYRGDKMNHAPVTFIRAGAKQPWARIEGFASASDIVREYRQLASR